jgi:hypothetical protein
MALIALQTGDEELGLVPGLPDVGLISRLPEFGLISGIPEFGLIAGLPGLDNDFVMKNSFSESESRSSC